MASSPEVSKEEALREVEGRLAQEPGSIEWQVERARLLIELRQFDGAKDAYLKILTKEPTHLVALNNLGALLNMMGYHKAALKVYREVVRLDPGNVRVRLNFADTLRECAELPEAREHYEIVLRESPDNKSAHRGLSWVLMYLGETEAAWKHHKSASAGPFTPKFSAPKKPDALRVLVLASPCGGNSPITKMLEDDSFQMLNLVPDFLDPEIPLPPHDLLINALGDADHCARSLEAAQKWVERNPGALINPPLKVKTTGRVDNSRLLGELEGVVTPRIAMFLREVLESGNAPTALAEQGFHFPLLVRTPGFHEGSHFVRIEKPDALAEAIRALPGRQLLVLEYLDARDEDGKIRKYRAMMIGGALYPLHKAVSREWMIHYYSADMAHSAEHRTEDEAYLNDMPGVLGPRAMAALERIRDALGLDYAGADFSLGKNGEVLLFEANATMVIADADPGAKWDFRRAPVQKIKDAVREMVRAKASAR